MSYLIYEVLYELLDIRGSMSYLIYEVIYELLDIRGSI